MKGTKKCTVVFAGDSTTDSNKLSTGDGLGFGYVSHVNNSLIAFRPWDRITVVNAGVSGNTSRDLLRRFDADVTAAEPDIVFCMIGINDVWRQIDMRANDIVLPDEYRANLTEICKKTQGKSKLVFMTPFFMEKNAADDMRKLTVKYADIMREVGKEFDVAVMDLQAVFDEFLKYRSGVSISWDRVHPDPVVAYIIAKEVLGVLETYLK